MPKFVNKIKKGRKSGREAYGKALDIPNEVSLLSEQSERESAVPKVSKAKVSKETAREPASKKLKKNFVEFDFEHGKKSIIKKRLVKRPQVLPFVSRLELIKNNIFCVIIFFVI